MAFIGKWGCFIHIPKTGGVWVKSVLKSNDDLGKYDGVTHGMPTRWSEYDNIFTCVRDPADYLASVWAHLWRNGWDTYPRSVPWQSFVELIREYKSEDFGEFIENITTHRTGIIHWFFTVHTPPPVVAVKTGDDTYKYLKSLGYDPDSIKPRNTGHNIPRLEEWHIRKIRESEKEAYAKWRF